MSKIKRASLIVVLILILSTLTGCVQSTVELKFNDDGSGEYSITVGIDNKRMEKEIASGNELGIDSARDILDEYIASDEYIYYKYLNVVKDRKDYDSIKAYFEFSDIKDMQNKLNKTYGVYSRYEGDTKGEARCNILPCITTTEELLKYTVHLNIPKEEITTEKFNIVIPEEGSNFEFKLTVPESARVLSHNSDFHRGNTYVWEIKEDLSNIKLDFEMDMMLGDVKAKVYCIYIPAVISVMIGLTLGIYWWKRDKARASELDDE